MTTRRPLRWHQRFLTPAARRVASWAGLITIAACALTTEVVPTSDVASVSVTPPTTTVAVGSQIPLQALVQDASGKPITGSGIFWSVQNPTIASISSAGIVTGMAIGSTEVSANVNGKSGIATITVQKAPVASVVVTPPHVDVSPNGQAQFTAIAYDAAQNALSDRTITWSTSNAGVATVDAGGLMIAVGQGSATITATSEGKTGVATVNVGQASVATVTVTPTPLSMSVGQTTQLAATLKDASGNVVTGPAVAWSSSNSAVATVTAQGMVTAVAAGSATITATSDGKTGSAALTISNVAVGSVSILPQGPSIVARSTMQLNATVLDVSGTVVTDRVVTWGSSTPAVATVSPTGLVAGVTPGTAVITATSEGKSGTTLVTVTPVPVGSVVLSPSAPGIRVTATLTLAPTVKDTNGTVVTDRVITWVSNNTAVATVTSAGVVTGVAPGTATITATSESKSGTSAVTVTKIPVGTVTLSPLTKSMLVTQTVALTPTVKDSVGTVVTDRVITWGSSNTAVATVSVTGAVTAVAPGTADITATSETKTGTSTITVALVPVSSVVVQPSPATITLTATAQLTALAKDSVGGVLTGRTVTWGSSDPTTVSVSSTGLITALKIGTATITATSEGKSGTSLVTVTKIPVSSVTVAPTTKAMLVTQTFALTPTVKDSVGNVVTDRPVSWGSNNTAVATVSAAGVVTAVAPGTAIITATSETKSGTSTITVSPVPVGLVVVQPGHDSLTIGTSRQFAAVTEDSIGGVLTGRVVTWGSSDPTTASVSATGGLVSALKLGTVTITATSEGKNGTSTVLVAKVPVGSVTVAPATKALLITQTAALTPTVRDSLGTIVTDRVVTWGSSNTLVATVTSAGVVTAVAPGSATITATSETKIGTSTITVSLVPVSSVVVSPPSIGIRVTATTQLIATTRDSIGGLLTGRVVTWGSSDPTVATVNATGLVTGVAAGTATITATSEGKSGTSTITVTKIPVGSVTVAPATKAMLVTQTFALTPTVRDTAGNVVTDRLVTWGSSNTAAATVSTSGVVTAVAPGTATITATSETQSGTSTITVSLVPVSTVAVTPPSAGVRITGTTQLTAVTKDSVGGVLTGRVVTWGSSDPTVATVNVNGLVTGVALGTATITATSEGKSGTSLVTVTKIPVGSVTVAPPSKTLLVTQTVSLTATVTDSVGTVVTDRVVTWGSNNTLVATVSSTGLVTALAPGTATITATSETKSGTSTITVSLVPVSSVVVSPPSIGIRVTATTQLIATTRDSIGGLLTGRVVTWGSSDPTVATVNATGLVTGVAAGTATITATSEGKSGTSTITVTKIPVGSVTVTPPTKAMLATQTFALATTVTDTAGNVVTDRVVTWGSNNTAAATVSPAGVVTAVAPGTATITATSETKSGTSTITVSLVPVSTVAVTPPTAGVRITGTTQLTAVTKDSVGGVLTGRVVTWGSSDPTVATVNVNGLVTGVALGTATITATSEGKSGTSLVTVTKIPVGSVTVAPPSKALLVTQIVALAATVTDSVGTVVTDRVVTWGSNNTLVATVTSAGLVTAVAPGTATITATSETKSGTGTITVSLVPVSTVVVQPAQDTLVVNGTAQLAATTKDSIGGVLTGRTVTWGSSDPTTASVSVSGLVTALKPGNATITATSEGKSGTSAITVLQAPVASVTVLPPSPDTVFIGYTTQLSAVTKDAGGGTLTGRVVTWQSDNTAAATVDATGLVTGVAAGTANITATSEGKSGSVTMVSTVAPVGSVVVAPASDSVTTTGTRPLTATVRDVKGTIVTDRPISWVSTQPTVASVAPISGSTVTVTGILPGTASIEATAETKTGSSAIKVIPAVVTVQIAPPTATLSLATTPTVQLAATLLDASSTIITGRTITWASSDNTIATVDSNGLVTAKAQGTASITATAVLGGVSSVPTVITVTP